MGMKEVNKAELVEILEDCGVDVTEKGIRTADIDNFLSAELRYAEDELEPIYNIVCQELMNQRPDLTCNNVGPIFRILDGEETVGEFEIVDADLEHDGAVSLYVDSPKGEASVEINGSGEVHLEELLERIEQSEDLP